ncbi:glycosyltransferase family 1 protein [Pontibacter virosus]|uniref:Glycosyltransferase involved in cell wall biosynthesis n=1 Tax=Pontibacter virosus TaxID=1765052 RepID=A0A2U1AUZ0_9BACT|nr:glycosyltransferase family 1 protein [Pontibacter virosus]PVY40246.1 glycosyltransferase involved in cell wall biosynthesis [Pontibacter virosus]
MFKTNSESTVPVTTDEDNSIVVPITKTESRTNKRSDGASSTRFQNLPDVVCLSHLRWDFVYQRPQHLLSRFAKHVRVFFVEEPLFTDCQEPYLQVDEREGQVHLVVPHIPHGMAAEAIEAAQRRLLDQLFAEHQIAHYLFWFYTPMALGFTDHFTPALTVYDCMDELSAFKFAPAQLKERELALFRKADLVFTGGQSLYEAKKKQHPQAHAFPSSIDKAHFAQARTPLSEPADQAGIPSPRIGFFGVIDERMDLGLLVALATARPEWQLIMIGPVVKIDPATLPQHSNIHHLGGKSYKELPAYLSGWDVALLPFAINESTEFISPTKTPEYLAAGKPVVSTPIRDVMRPYGEAGLVHIADTPEAFITAVEDALLQQQDEAWLAAVDGFMADLSWDNTWSSMTNLVTQALELKKQQKS